MSRPWLQGLLAVAAAALVGYGVHSDHEAPARSTQAAGPLATVQVSAPSRAAAARRPNVVMLVLDEFPADLLRRPDGRIDASRFPNFANLAGTSTWFPNATTVFDETSWAVPAILDGRLPRPNTAADFGDHPNNVFTMLGRRGYKVVSHQVATALCPPPYCRGPRTAPSELPFLLNRRSERLRAWVRSIRPRKTPGFYFKHEFLPHKPWVYLPSGKHDQPTNSEPVPGINSTKSFRDRYLTNHNERRQLLQLGFVDRQIGYLLRRLRKTGLLNRTLLVVTADHGYAWELDVSDRRKVTDGNVDEVATVPLFVKAPKQRRGRTVGSLVRTSDIVPTIADLLNIPMGYKHDGRSAFGPTVRRRRSVRLRTRDFQRVVAIGAKDLEARRLKNRVRRFGLFSGGAESRKLFGSPWTSVYRWGPHPELIGRRVATFKILPAGGVKAQVAGAPPVKGSSAIIRTHIAGRITGGKAKDRRVIAVSANGVVRALGRSFYLLGEDRESFATLLAESALRRGRNVIRVWEVAERNGDMSLIPLRDSR